MIQAVRMTEDREQKMDRNIQQKYWRRAKIVSLILMLAPFVRGVFLNGSLAKGEATEKSDIDFLIVAQKNRLWTGRVFATLFVHLTGLRRYDDKIAGRICLNRYQATDFLTISPKDKKNAVYHASTKILWAEGNIAADFIAQNQWMQKYHCQINIKPQKNIIRHFTRPFQFAGEFLFDLILKDWGEAILKKYQTNRILADPRTKKSPLGAIFLSNKELRFHPSKDIDK